MTSRNIFTGLFNFHALQESETIRALLFRERTELQWPVVVSRGRRSYILNLNALVFQHKAFPISASQGHPLSIVDARAQASNPCCLIKFWWLSSKPTKMPWISQAFPWRLSNYCICSIEPIDLAEVCAYEDIIPIFNYNRGQYFHI